MPHWQKPESGQTGANKCLAEYLSYYPGGSPVLLLLFKHWMHNLFLSQINVFLLSASNNSPSHTSFRGSCINNRQCTRGLMLSTVPALPQMYSIRFLFFDAIISNSIVSFSSLFFRHPKVCRNSFKMTHRFCYIITTTISSNQCVKSSFVLILSLFVTAVSGREFTTQRTQL